MRKKRISSEPVAVRTVPFSRKRFKVGLKAMGRPIRSLTLGEFFESLPHLQSSNDLREVAQRVGRAHRRHKPVIFAMGAHVIKCGLQPVIKDLIDHGIVTALALNGAGVIHDFELAYGGGTSEWVEEGIKDGSFGMTRETGQILNSVAKQCLATGAGLGETIAEHLDESSYPYKEYSLLAAAHAMGIPVTVHVAIGCDTIHMHPQASGQALGEGSLRDFRIFSHIVRTLGDGGVFFNIGSSVMMPEVFLKAVSLARNQGVRLRNFTTVNMDFLTHYRPLENVLRRPHLRSGDAFNIVGAHEIMLPLMAAAIKVALKSRK
ncbi:MAG: hypothetical protein HYX75_02390 [Acidobacteria bacterium]|nr:hypothetical protein [Acidobacteriota bacterium]